MTQAASRRTAIPTGSSYIHEAGLVGDLAPEDVAGVDAQDERGLGAADPALEQVGLAGREQERLGIGGHEGVDDRLHVLDALEQVGLAGHAVVDGDGQAAARVGMEEAVEPVGVHPAQHTKQPPQGEGRGCQRRGSRSAPHSAQPAAYGVTRSPQLGHRVGSRRACASVGPL